MPGREFTSGSTQRTFLHGNVSQSAEPLGTTITGQSMSKRGRKRWIDEEPDEGEDSVNGERSDDDVQSSAKARVKFDEELGESEEKTNRCVYFYHYSVWELEW